MTNEELTAVVQGISAGVFSRPFRHAAYFNKRLRTTGGRYMLSTHAIEINPASYERYGYRELEGIIKHELCHYHLHLEGKGYKHRDADFKKLLKETDSPRFCQLPTERKGRTADRQYRYQCLSCRTNYARKIRMSTEKYRCGKCRGKLQLL
ncbi:SprT family protein [Planococcus lenghuensis]|uniref:SprT family protein n=1 Tax=Planococcus lenghuensis TaxID=2213202 RepID=A0A1Q2KVC3_9BACL|nr:SprT family protein [Planococcus lenghuensis]AQQ52151.1 SprT family protein [Planococcus lenghuensis]